MPLRQKLLQILWLGLNWTVLAIFAYLLLSLLTALIRGG